MASLRTAQRWLGPASQVASALTLSSALLSLAIRTVVIRRLHWQIPDSLAFIFLHPLAPAGLAAGLLLGTVARPRTKAARTWTALAATLPLALAMAFFAVDPKELGPRLHLPFVVPHRTWTAAVLAPNTCRNHCQTPTNCAQECTNADGFRGPTLIPGLGHLQVAIIGDSYVFGSGLPATEMLGPHLQAELARVSPQAGWQVATLGIPGQNFSDSVQLAVDLLRTEAPSVLVVSWISGNDEVPVSPRERLNLLGKHILALLGLIAADGQLDRAQWAAEAPWLGSGRQPPADVQRQFLSDRELLMQSAKLHGTRLLIIDYRGTGEFADLQAQGRIEVVSGRPQGPSPQPWQMVGDGHPTGVANREIARRLAALSLWYAH